MKKIPLIALSLVIFISCSKDDPPKPQTCTTSTASIAGNYKITAVTYKATATSTEVDYMNLLFPDACDRDNVYTFKTDGTYQIADAGQVCSPAGNDNGNWTLTGTNLQIDGDPVILESFDCKVLVISNTDIDVTGDKLKLTFTRQ